MLTLFCDNIPPRRLIISEQWTLWTRGGEIIKLLTKSFQCGHRTELKVLDSLWIGYNMDIVSDTLYLYGYLLELLWCLYSRPIANKLVLSMFYILHAFHHVVFFLLPPLIIFMRFTTSRHEHKQTCY